MLLHHNHLLPLPSSPLPLKHTHLYGKDGPHRGAAEVLLHHDAHDFCCAALRRRAASPQHVVVEAVTALGVLLIPEVWEGWGGKGGRNEQCVNREVGVGVYVSRPLSMW